MDSFRIYYFWNLMMCCSNDSLQRSVLHYFTDDKQQYIDLYFEGIVLDAFLRILRSTYAAFHYTDKSVFVSVKKKRVTIWPLRIEF